SGHNRSGINRGGVMATFPVQPAALGAASVRTFSRPPPAAPRPFSGAALAILAEWLVAPLRRRIFFGTFATLLLVVALPPGIYPLLVNRSADRMPTLSPRDRPDEPLTQLPAPTLSGPLPAGYSASVGPADRLPVEVDRVQALQQALSAERKQLRTVTEG